MAAVQIRCEGRESRRRETIGDVLRGRFVEVEKLGTDLRIDIDPE